jgi:hypothetical protein
VRVGRAIHLRWSEADTGGSPITGYQIWRGTASNAETFLTNVTGTQIGGSFDDFTATDSAQTYYYKVFAVNSVGTSCGNNEIAAPYIGDACTGIVIHKNDPSHTEANAGTSTPASLLIDYVAVGEPANAPGNFLFKMKVNSLSSVPTNSRWRIMFDPPGAADPGLQYYLGMTTGASGSPVFEYGTLTDAGVPGLFVIGESKQGSCTVSGTSCTLTGAGAASQYNADGTISIIAPKSAFGNPQPGDLLGAIGGRTFTGDASGTPAATYERSNTFIDHTFIKAQTDNSYPAATYTVLGNSACEGGIVPISAVSRKTHAGAGVFDVDLPLSGKIGIEPRSGGTNGDYQVAVTFPTNLIGTPPTATVSAGSVSAVVTSGNQVFVFLTNVPNAQRLTITLLGVNDGTNTGNVSIPMGVLLGDTTADGFVNSTDIAQTKSQSGQLVTASNFREDVTVDGNINSTDIAQVKSKSGTALP